ncbi:hypothetical protein YC2023_061208 [Brassica napus]
MKFQEGDGRRLFIVNFYWSEILFVSFGLDFFSLTKGNRNRYGFLDFYLSLQAGLARFQTFKRKLFK